MDPLSTASIYWKIGLLSPHQLPYGLHQRLHSSKNISNINTIFLGFNNISGLTMTRPNPTIQTYGGNIKGPFYHHITDT